jgi:hypothetical protein
MGVGIKMKKLAVLLFLVSSFAFPLRATTYYLATAAVKILAFTPIWLKLFSLPEG